MSILVTSMDQKFRIFLKILNVQGYDTNIEKINIKKLHFANWVIWSDEGIWFLKSSNAFFHLKGEAESIDVAILDKIVKNEMIHYMTFIFAMDDAFYSIGYDKFLEKREVEPYVGKDGVKRWIIRKEHLRIWNVNT